jgi:hypothetical protein
LYAIDILPFLAVEAGTELVRQGDQEAEATDTGQKFKF